MTCQPRTRTAAILAALLVATLLAACAAVGAGPDSKPGSDGSTGVQADRGNVGAPPAGEPGLPGAVDGKVGETQGGPDPYAALADRQIIKTGEITIEVSDVVAALGKVRALAVQLGGYVGASQSGGYQPNPDPYPPVPYEKQSASPQSASLTLRIPADKFDDAIARLHAFDGTIVIEATREEDVTSQLVDIEARLTNLQASEVQYRTLLEKAEKIEDILAVQARLDEVRMQIEQWQAQQKQLSELANLATLTVTITSTAIQQATDTWNPGKTVADAFAALVTFGQNVTKGIIWFAIVWLPALIVLGVILLLGWRFIPRPRRVAPPASTLEAAAVESAAVEAAPAPKRKA